MLFLNFVYSDFCFALFLLVTTIDPLSVANKYERRDVCKFGEWDCYGRQFSQFPHFPFWNALNRLGHLVFFVWTLTFGLTEMKQYVESHYYKPSTNGRCRAICTGLIPYASASHWDLVDIIAFFICISWYPLIIGFDNSVQVHRELMTYGVLGLLIKFLSFMRGFKRFAALLGMIKQIVVDMVNFYALLSCRCFIILGTKYILISNSFLYPHTYRSRQ